MAAILGLFTTSAFAQDPVKVEGKMADALLSALAEGGAYVDCGMGKCGVTASDIACTKTMSQTPNPVCTLKVQNEQGAKINRRLVGMLALNLTDALIEAGTVGCGTESCTGTASSIACLSSTDPGTGASNSSCTIY